MRWISWECETHNTWFSLEGCIGDWEDCVTTHDCRVNVYHEGGTGSNAYGVRGIMFDHDSYQLVAKRSEWLPQWMK